MISEKQLAANRANAQKSTGPKTEETKKIVSRNALRHGLTAQVTIMPDEDREAHDNFCAAIIASLAPEGALETQFAQAIAEDNWRLNRGRAIETNLFALGVFQPVGPNIDTGRMVRPYPLEAESTTNALVSALVSAQVFAADPKQFQLLSLYMQGTNRDMQKTLDRLEALQTDRKARRQQDLEEAAALVQFNEIRRLPVTDSELKGPNGFVFSTSEIHAFLHRKSRLTQLQTIQDRQNNHHNHKNNHRRHEKLQHAKAA